MHHRMWVASATNVRTSSYGRGLQGTTGVLPSSSSFSDADDEINKGERDQKWNSFCKDEICLSEPSGDNNASDGTQWTTVCDSTEVEPGARHYSSAWLEKVLRRSFPRTADEAPSWCSATCLQISGRMSFTWLCFPVPPHHHAFWMLGQTFSICPPSPLHLVIVLDTVLYILVNLKQWNKFHWAQIQLAFSWCICPSVQP